ncbi:MAG: M36 family metallopeptidase, partial [Solirubrobacteraceae bacterium]
TVDLDADSTWLNRSNGFTILRGNNAHAYADTGAPNGVNGGENIAPSGGTDWLFPQVPFTVSGQSCPAAGCSWDSTSAATAATNRNQATTQLFYFVNRFHDHLAAPPIGFTPAARNFEFSADPGGGIGGDAVLAEADDYAVPNNASMSTPQDGGAPRLQAGLFTNPSLNAADDASVVYHEYAHGLTNRSVGSGAGLDADQSRAMGEGWSDWYALDYLVQQGLVSDNPAVNGELQIGGYVAAGGLRREGTDCPVGASAPACPGTAGAGPGGFTFGDLGHVGAIFEVHDDGEIWAQTLWDLRRALGSATARALITGGLRLAPNNPSMLEARDAIILADEALGAPNHALLWQLFAARGMGYGATTTSASASTAQEAFDLPPLLTHAAATVTDPAPGGDGDDVAEPGETVRIGEALRNANPFAVTGVSGRLTSSSPGVVAVQPES